MFSVVIDDSDKADILLDLARAVGAVATIKQVVILETEDKELARMAERLAGAPAAAKDAPVKRAGGRGRRKADPLAGE
jgi:hypothetical protein